jgi:hypothetical protein
VKNVKQRESGKTDYHHANWGSKLGEKDAWRHFQKKNFGFGDAKF